MQTALLSLVEDKFLGDNHVLVNPYYKEILHKMNVLLIQQLINIHGPMLKRVMDKSSSRL